MELTNFWSFVNILLPTLMFKDFHDSLDALMTYKEFQVNWILNLILGFLGSVFIFIHLNIFGPNSVAMITSIRKIFSVLVSFIIFNHSIGIIRIISIIIILLCIYFDKKITHNNTNNKVKAN